MTYDREKRREAPAVVPSPAVATCGYNWAMETGVRQLRDNLSRYLRRIEAGEHIAVTAHGRVVAEPGPPAHVGEGGGRRRYDELLAAGVIQPAVEEGDPLEDWPDIQLARGHRGGVD